MVCAYALTCMVLGGTTGMTAGGGMRVESLGRGRAMILIGN
jgi:hypothetical protein